MTNTYQKVTISRKFPIYFSLISFIFIYLVSDWILLLTNTITYTEHFTSLIQSYLLVAFGSILFLSGLRLGLNKNKICASSSPSLNTSRRSKSILNNYKIGEQIHYKAHQKIPTLFFVGKQPILTINNNVIYDLDELQHPIIILQQSPKINIERLIKTLKPRQIIADGSNYQSMTEHWEISCKKNNVPFWSTYKNGAYKIQFN